MTMLLDEETITTDAIHIVVADDHPRMRGDLRQVLISALPDVAISEASDLGSLGREMKQGQPVDLVLLDLAMPGVSGFSGLLYLRSKYPDIPIVVISANEDRGIMRRCVEVGAAGFMSKSTGVEPMREAIRQILAGEIWVPSDLDLVQPADAVVADMMRRLTSLTPQQLRVLMMLTQGLLNKQIAFELKVSEATVKAHVSAILQKLDVDSRTQAVLAVSKIDQGELGMTHRALAR